MSKTFDILNVLIGRVQHCSTAVLRCTDFRVRTSDQEFVEEFLLYIGEEPNFDSYVWPGSQKDIMNCETFQLRWLELFQRVSLRHHGVKRLIVIMHYDCFGYAGVKEEEIFQKELTAFRSFLSGYLSGTEIVLVYSQAIPGVSDLLRYVVLD